ncbi:MAG: glutamate-5-semialdehyde dehydrogenase [Candidatus Omnitrophica bacterium]|nr:glutamate-5-semialdehyde dehydrogenase [Candidatus Omnitrophota bacterium]MBU0880833.1 glutamate-5-semialdehyde dehydrogenase [Candidatus Omnitrophota bacterium]MBU0895375.1 glutamate-5-semialdehyde dehydrogenase [Candidatus Omnitrophota bacterium]MBU1038075.1 glutamate-5-semialdehyde dehydrogenase [Candidatus Omnitrophota bacterium]MBU1807988.1 glutamate-5-semialdehyde dehydrogenase [Candidatus Omnitrophota bacterium]
MMSADDIKRLCRKVKSASRELALTDTKTKDRVLIAMSKALIKRASYIVRENERDLASAKRKGLSPAYLDRLRLTVSGISGMAKSLSVIARFKDPVGEVIETLRRPNGLLIKKVRVPIGVILIIYEARPNVTGDCIGLCLKSSNALILRGGSEALNSNIAIFDILNDVAVKNGLPANSIAMIRDTDRRIVKQLLESDSLIDLVIPRGGESLIREVTKTSRIPVIKHYKGVCHTYVDRSADLKMAENICFNAKVQRPGVCNAMETMLVHRKVAKKFLSRMIKRFSDSGVEIRGDAETRRIAPYIKRAVENDWYTEYLGLILSVKVVTDIDEAIAHIMKYGSYHSDAIVTGNKKNAGKFLDEVDSACVYVNCSTRFTDGAQFGKGAEMGISTDKLHARGPMGLEELTSYKYVIYGTGQVRR